MRNIQNINIRYGSGVPVPCDPKRIRDLSPDPFLFILTDEKGGSPARGGPLFIFSTSPVLYLLGACLPHPSSPARRGSTSLLNPPLLRREDLKPGRLGLYSQTSSRPYGVARNCLRNRIASVYAPRARCRIHTSADTPLWLSSIRRVATGA